MRVERVSKTTRSACGATDGGTEETEDQRSRGSTGGPAQRAGHTDGSDRNHEWPHDSEPFMIPVRSAGVRRFATPSNRRLCVTLRKTPSSPLTPLTSLTPLNSVAPFVAPQAH